MTIAYDGTRYAGWQAQNRRQKAEDRRQNGQKPTVQGTLETTLRRILQERVAVVGSGRTDAGVHAAAQVAHARTRSPMPCGRLLRSLNALLPPDIAVLRIEDAPAAFHARFDAATKRYRYRIALGEAASPFDRPYVYHARARLNVARMRREAVALAGRHDFRAFARWKGEAPTRARRTITDVRLARLGQEVRLEVEGDGFLHTMVRSIAGTLIDVGRGHLPSGTIRRMLATGDRRLAGTTAPPHGLILMEVRYRRTTLRRLTRRGGSAIITRL